jgi:hypothetical protein
MSDIVNTLRGPKLFPKGTIRGLWYIIPIQDAPITAQGFFQTGQYTHAREYYQLRSDGEWHWSHTEDGKFQKYPCYEEPEWQLPEGV